MALTAASDGLFLMAENRPLARSHYQIPLPLFQFRPSDQQFLLYDIRERKEEGSGNTQGVRDRPSCFAVICAVNAGKSKQRNLLLST